MHFALLGHSAKYVLKTVGLFHTIEDWAPSQYHLVVVNVLEVDALRASVSSAGLPVERTSVHALDQLPPWALALHQSITANTTSGPGAIPCWKLFVPFLPSMAHINNLIFVDGDLLLMQDPRPLWEYFDIFAPSHLLGLAMNHDGITGLNSGVMLMKMDRMRGIDSMWVRALRHGVARLQRRPQVKLGWLADQTFLSLLAGWTFNSDSLFEPKAAPLFGRVWMLPCGWNRQLSIHASQEPNFWPRWAACTEPCRLAHFSGVFCALPRLRRTQALRIPDLP